MTTTPTDAARRMMALGDGHPLGLFPIGPAAAQALELAKGLEAYQVCARALGVSDDRSRDLLEGEMVKARVRPDFTVLDALATANLKLAMIGPEDPWYWLSFADAGRPKGEQFLGVLVIQAPSFEAAVWRSHRDQLNPGGECRGDALPADLVPDEDYRARLLDKAEASELAAALDKRRGLSD